MSITAQVTRTHPVHPELVSGTFICLDCQTAVKNVLQQFKYTQVLQLKCTINRFNGGMCECLMCNIAEYMSKSTMFESATIQSRSKQLEVRRLSKSAHPRDTIGVAARMYTAQSRSHIEERVRGEDASRRSMRVHRHIDCSARCN